MQIGFSSAFLAGETISNAMGLGFAAVVDPQTRGRSSAVSQFIALIATLAFLSVNGHLVMLEALGESFISMPISAAPMSGAIFYQLAKWGGTIFGTGLQLALPIIAALLITNVALGILTRAAPQLNIFGIGFPVTLGVGLVLISATLPYMNVPLQDLFNRGIETMRLLPRSAAERQVRPPAPAPAPLRRPNP